MSGFWDSAWAEGIEKERGMSPNREGQLQLQGLQGRLTVAPGVNFQSLGDGEDGVVLSLSSGQLYRCNHTAIVVLDLLRNHPTIDGLVADFARRFEIDANQAQADILPLIRHLVDERIVEKAA